MKKTAIHQYIERETSLIKKERFLGDLYVRFLYSCLREKAPHLFNFLTSPRISSLLAGWVYDRAAVSRFSGKPRLFGSPPLDLSECVEDPRRLNTVRKRFERKIRYWETRPMPLAARIIVSPSDSRVLPGSFNETSLLNIKEKFFSLQELLDDGGRPWRPYFRKGDYMIFRLTPEKYHYNHTPVSGKVLDIYGIDGTCHSCHPEALITLAAPFSKNRRVVTIFDTDVEGGSQSGLVAMVEVVALLVGDITQCYSDSYYENPQPIVAGMMVKKGQPKSLYRPGSSTTILVFQRGRVVFCRDISTNIGKRNVFTLFFNESGKPLVETEVRVRSPIAMGVDQSNR
jgi:phosphatidylserine decarboxylase